MKPSHLLPLLLLALVPLYSCADKGVSLAEIPLPSVSERFPLTHQSSDIVSALTHPKSEDGKNAAIEGVLEEEATDGYGNPFLKIRISPDVYLWVLHATPLARDTFVRIGNSYKVMGWLRETDSMPDGFDIKKTNGQTLLLQSICVVESTTLNSAFDSKYIEFCEAWLKGYAVNDLAD